MRIWKDYNQARENQGILCITLKQTLLYSCFQQVFLYMHITEGASKSNLGSACRSLLGSTNVKCFVKVSRGLLATRAHTAFSCQVSYILLQPSAFTLPLPGTLPHRAAFHSSNTAAQHSNQATSPHFCPNLFIMELGFFQKVYHVEKALQCKNNAIYQPRQGDCQKMINFPYMAVVYHQFILTSPCTCGMHLYDR